MSRKDPETSNDEVLIPEQPISLHDAIAGYTIGAAYTNFLDTKTGSIEIGKYADLVVLSKNLFDILVEKISDARVLTTILEGEVVYATY